MCMHMPLYGLYLVCILSKYCMYLLHRYKLEHIRTCLYLHVSCLYLVSVLSEFHIYLECILI